MSDFRNFVDNFQFPTYLSFNDLKYGYKKLGLIKFVVCILLFLSANKRKKSKKNSNIKRRAVSRNMSISLNNQVDSSVSSLKSGMKNIRVLSSDLTKKENRSVLKYGRKKIRQKVQRKIDRKKTNVHLKSLRNRKMSPSRLKRKQIRAEKFVFVSNWDKDASIQVTDYCVIVKLLRQRYDDPSSVLFTPDEFVDKYKSLRPYFQAVVKNKLVLDLRKSDMESVAAANEYLSGLLR
jgi:hypothetical protein